MRGKTGAVALLALLSFCGIGSAARDGSGRATGPTGASPAPPAPPAQEQKPSEPPKSQRPTDNGQDAQAERERQARADERRRLSEEYHHPKK